MKNVGAMKTEICDEGFAKLVLDTMPLCCEIWDKDYNIINCNEICVKQYRLRNKQEYIERFFELFPEYQSDGRRSDEMVRSLVKQAFDEGSAVFKCESRLPDGTLLPEEVTLVRVKNGDDFVVAAYTRDLREQKQMMHAIEERNIFLDTMNTISNIMLQTDADRFDSDLFRSMDIMARVTNSDRMYIWQNYNKGGRLYCSQVYEWSEGAPPQQGRAFTKETLYSDVVPEWVEKFSQGLSINGIVRTLSANEQAALSPQGILSILVMPLFFGNQFWGFVGFDDCHKERLFSKHEELILHTASQLLANALSRKEETLRAREVEERIKLMLDATPLCCQLWDININCIDCNEAAVKLYGLKNKQEYIEKFFDLLPEYQSDGQRSDVKARMNVKKAFEEGFCHFEWMHQMQDGTPIPAEVTLVRVKYGDSFVVAGYTRDLRDIKKLEKNIQWLQTEADKIYYDSLTVIYNRRFFDETIGNLVKILSRSGSLLSILMIDIDYFKNYNDTYGHIAGDRCLRVIAETLTKCTTRIDDYVARYGGEEFIVVLPNTSKHGACVVADRMLKSIHGCNMPHEKSDAAPCVTISIGITTGKVEYTHNEDSYVKRADEALYKSKQNGRNRWTYENL